MLLSRLELSGFKSFPHRTELLFDEGIMGVVGPNGCGKTNVVDSIRWVLGEQRSSMLRGARIEEVLFNGTSQLRPIDLAEVSLTIKNNRGVLPLEYDEVVVTRRLFRSGESEYLINRSRCRLRDIIELFSDTGMGTHAYSIFQQSMVDAVLSEKTEERRFLFEEAAGITKYKVRKKEALRKLETTEVDLVRLSDIISEISKNVRGLKKQASRARQYKEFRALLQNLEITRAAARMYDLQTTLKSQTDQSADLLREKEGLRAAIDKESSSIEDLRLGITVYDEQIAARALRSAQLSEQVIRTENNLNNIQSSLETGRKNVELWSKEIGDLKERAELLGHDRKQAEAEHSVRNSELLTLQASIAEKEGLLESLKGKLDSSEAELDSLKEAINHEQNELAGETARHDTTADALARLMTSNRQIGDSIARFREKQQEAERNLNDQRQKLDKCEAEIARIDETMSSFQKKHLDTVAEIEETKNNIAAINVSSSAAATRVEMLSKMIIEHEGYGSGVKALFAWDGRPEGVIDTLANLVAVDGRYREAIETALERYGHVVVCRSRSDAERCFDYLRENGLGRASMLCLDRVGEATQVPGLEHSGYLGNADKFITAESYLLPGIRALFGQTAVFVAHKIPDGLPYEAVDLAGRYYHPLGLTVGGKSSQALVGRKGELAELEKALAELDRQRSLLERRLGALTGAQKKLEQDIAEFSGRREMLSSVRQKIISEMTQSEFEFKEASAHLDELSSNNAQSADQTDGLASQRTTLAESIARRHAAVGQLQETIKSSFASLASLKRDYDFLVTEINQSRLKVVELTGLLTKLEEGQRRLGELIAEAGNIIRGKTDMIELERNNWQRLGEEQNELRVELAGLFKARDKVGEEKDGIANEKAALVERLSQSEAQLKQLAAKQNSLSEEIHQQDLRSNEIEGRLKNARENIYHEFGVHVEPAKAADFDENSLGTEIERLNRILDKIGAVNMLADDEYSTEKDRLDFLEKQYKDLLEARASLLDVIRRINRTAEEKFSEAFESIRENFQEVFQTLFSGGQAELRLTSPDDLLESPIEIIARPQGKKLISVNQLSGGERALTAISLLFAIYMVKPSPFCILDEIDAPLDDANVNRFLELINKFTTNTQFIVITHNKRTMEAADILYGVTMQQPGVSTIVSVKFDGNKVGHAQ